MMSKIKAHLGASTVGVLLLSGASAASALPVLEGRTITGGRVSAYAADAVMVYDPSQNLTWLRNWNPNGAKTWLEQVAWVSNLQVGAYANWSLPTARNPSGTAPCEGFDCTGSQMGHLWYDVLGNSSHRLTNAGPFQNLMESAYWTGTEREPGSFFAWILRTYDGGQNWTNKTVATLYAVAVRPGDVASPVPEPQVWALWLLGLGCIAAVSQRRVR